MDTGALTGFTYLFQWRERVYDIFESICGARLTTNIGRIGGFDRQWPDKTWELIDAFLAEYPAALNEFNSLLLRNRIFMDRTIGCGAISAERALEYSFSGPNLRAAGVEYDVRVINPYSSYEDFDFDIPLGTQGDVYDRMMVRDGEMWESMKIITQAVAKIKALGTNEYQGNVPEFLLPAKEEVYKTWKP